MDENIYRRLAEHLDHLPDGFAPSKNGSDLRLLMRLFTPEEAQLAVHLTLEREASQIIAERAALPLDQVQPLLDEMERKGLIFASQGLDGVRKYQSVPLVVGIYELQINNMSPELLNDFISYWSSTEEREPVDTIPQMRTIPVGESIENHPEVLPYEKVNELVAKSDQFAVANCICRHTAKMAGEGCDAPEESCLIFGDWANFYVDTGRARSIGKDEVFQILKRADAANLVLQPSNSRKIEFICCCCGCCCGVLGSLKRHPRAADYVASGFIAQFNLDACQGCWTCLDRCQMGALVANETHVIFKAERCIGCGLCVTTCPNDALLLVRKPESLRTNIPATMDETWRIIVEDQEKTR